MKTTTKKKTIRFHLNKKLVKRLKDMAKNERITFNQLIERLLSDATQNAPNEITIAAIEEARSGSLRDSAPVDTSSVEAMFKSAGL